MHVRVGSLTPGISEICSCTCMYARHQRESKPISLVLFFYFFCSHGWSSISTTRKHSYYWVSGKATTPPLFLLRELSGETKHVFINPINNLFNCINFPKLESQSGCLSSYFGWLLILSRGTYSLFFFNSITHCGIDLPFWNHIFAVEAFSAPPASLTALFSPWRRLAPLVNFIWILLQWDKKIGPAMTSLTMQGCLHCADLRGRIGFEGRS